MDPHPTPSAGEIITFYSYKGGTGRTMALANVACVLAEDDHTTVVADAAQLQPQRARVTVFLSYAQADAQRVRQLEETLEARGFDVLSPATVPSAGVSYARAVSDALGSLPRKDRVAPDPWHQARYGRSAESLRRDQGGDRLGRQRDRRRLPDHRSRDQRLAEGRRRSAGFSASGTVTWQ